MLLNTGEDWQPSQEQVDAWKKAYPAVSYDREWAAIEAWCLSNKQKRKTSRGASRFVNSWLARAQDKGGSPMAKVGGIRVRDMTDLDYLTHDFMNSESYRERCLERYGQYFSNGKRVTA